MKTPMIYADFMKMDDAGRLVLICRGTFEDLAKNEIVLKEGMKLTFYNEDEDDDGKRDDLIVEGEIEYDKENERWTAKIDWDEIKNISNLTPNQRKNIGI